MTPKKYYSQAPEIHSTVVSVIRSLKPGFTVHDILDAWPMPIKPGMNCMGSVMRALTLMNRVKIVGKIGYAHSYRYVKPREPRRSQFEKDWTAFKLNPTGFLESL